MSVLRTCPHCGSRRSDDCKNDKPAAATYIRSGNRLRVAITRADNKTICKNFPESCG